ncbi:MAG: hypothetical protein Q8M37_07815 [Nevskia sp.]|nr:hypothetical protein [Nevskia sp.]
MNLLTDEQADPSIRPGPEDVVRTPRPALHELLAAYRNSGSIPGRKMLISQLCLELRARDAQKQQAFYGRVSEVLSAAERYRARA